LPREEKFMKINRNVPLRTYINIYVRCEKLEKDLLFADGHDVEERKKEKAQNIRCSQYIIFCIVSFENLDLYIGEANNVY
jgi:hypothetical protein